MNSISSTIFTGNKNNIKNSDYKQPSSITLLNRVQSAKVLGTYKNDI